MSLFLVTCIQTFTGKASNVKAAINYCKLPFLKQYFVLHSTK